MFGSKEQEGDPIAVSSASEDTIIGKTIKIEGDLISDGDIVVEGEVSGSVKTKKSQHPSTLSGCGVGLPCGRSALVPRAYLPPYLPK